MLSSKITRGLSQIQYKKKFKYKIKIDEKQLQPLIRISKQINLPNGIDMFIFLLSSLFFPV